MSKSFALAGIDSKGARASFFLDENGEKVKVPKAMSKTFTVGKQELTVKYRIGKKFEDIRLYIRLHNCYDPESAAEHILSADEVIDRYDPKRNSDAFLFAEEELDEEALTPLEKDACLDRMAWFAAVCEQLANDRALEQIAQEAPKKKDGTFAKNRATVVASCPIVISKHMAYFELVAKPKTDTQLDVTIQKRTFSRGAAQRFLNEALLSADAAASAEADVLPKTTVKLFYKYKNAKKKTFDIPAVILPNGQLAIAAKPYRALVEFSCVKGSDEKGYEVLEPVNRQPVTVNSKGMEIECIYDVFEAPIGLWVAFNYMEDLQKYLKKGGKSEREKLMYAFGTDEKGKLFSRCTTQEFLAEFAYQTVCCMEGVHDLVSTPDLSQCTADTAARKKDGSLNRGGAGAKQRFTVPSAPCREIPLVTGCVEAFNEGNTQIRFTYRLQYCEDNTWSEYKED